mmetsp:Transcript_13340/g.40341  ORF Transcript_13340/g.40341 Transcript_13340/m.40341 type:complete len:323 (-) Transcript_13340:1265-2233(-)
MRSALLEDPPRPCVPQMRFLARSMLQGSPLGVISSGPPSGARVAVSETQRLPHHHDYVLHPHLTRSWQLTRLWLRRSGIQLQDCPQGLHSARAPLHLCRRGTRRVPLATVPRTVIRRNMTAPRGAALGEPNRLFPCRQAHPPPHPPKRCHSSHGLLALRLARPIQISHQLFPLPLLPRQPRRLAVAVNLLLFLHPRWTGCTQLERSRSLHRHPWHLCPSQPRVPHFPVGQDHTQHRQILRRHLLQLCPSHLALLLAVQTLLWRLPSRITLTITLQRGLSHQPFRHIRLCQHHRRPVLGNPVPLAPCMHRTAILACRGLLAWA